MAVSLSDILDSFHKQAGFCDHRGAVFTANVIKASARNIECGGALAALVENFAENPWKGALPLRVAGAFHALYLKDENGPLSIIYKDPASGWTSDQLSEALIDAVEENQRHFEFFIARPPQTNEVRRAAALLPAFLEIADKTEKPMRLCEIGASAGLLLNWDRFRFNFGDFIWGEGDLEIASEWRGRAPDRWGEVSVHDRRGCDLYPVDIRDEHALLRARSYIWPEQPERRALFDNAIPIAVENSIAIDQCDAIAWLQRELTPLQEGFVSVLYHSVFAVYLSDNQIKPMNGAIQKAARSATAAAPFAYVSFEPVPKENGFSFIVDLTIWPGGDKKRIAEADAHGAWVLPV